MGTSSGRTIKLCLGDRLRYLEILRTHNFDLVRVERALALYGL